MINSNFVKENIKDFINIADHFIIGSTFRTNGDFFGELEEKRLKEFVEEFNKLRKI